MAVFKGKEVAMARVLWLGLLLLLAAQIPAAAQILREPLATLSGRVEAISAKSLTVRDADGNTLQFVCTHKTRYYDGARRIKSSGISRGDRVSVDTKRYPDGELEAINVRLEPKKKPS
jgi:hypothetical protein